MAHIGQDPSKSGPQNGSKYDPKMGQKGVKIPLSEGSPVKKTPQKWTQKKGQNPFPDAVFGSKNDSILGCLFEPGPVKKGSPGGSLGGHFLTIFGHLFTGFGKTVIFK